MNEIIFQLSLKTKKEKNVCDRSCLLKYTLQC